MSDKTDIFLMALDKSERDTDVDGRLHISKSHISKAAVNPYYGKEIPDYVGLGLDPDKVYNLLRDPEELEKSAESFKRLPILSSHEPIGADSHRPDLVIGSIGSDVYFEHPYLNADLCFWDSSSIAGIETKEVCELSCGYRYKPVMEQGVYDGVAYDGRMTDIVGNHLALVEYGRAGPDVFVADENPFKKIERVETMKFSKLGKAMFVSVGSLSPALANDSDLHAIVGNANKKTFKKKEALTKLMALDANLSAQQLDNIIDALLDVEQEDAVPLAPPAAAVDESPADKLRSLLRGKVDDETIEAACNLISAPAAADESGEEKEEQGMKKEEVKAAMDGLRKELREAEEARKDVRDIIGDVSGVETAEEVYSFALDKMSIDRTDVSGAPALRAIFKVARVALSEKQTPRIAFDSSSPDNKFPGLSRFIG